MTKINSAYGDSLFYSRVNAVRSFKHYVKPENHTLLKKGKQYLATTNKRSTGFRKDGWKIIGRGTVKGKRFEATKIPIRMVKR